MRLRDQLILVYSLKKMRENLKVFLLGKTFCQKEMHIFAIYFGQNQA